jgi:hypothetical protein
VGEVGEYHDTLQYSPENLKKKKSPQIGLAKSTDTICENSSCGAIISSSK